MQHSKCGLSQVCTSCPAVIDAPHWLCYLRGVSNLRCSSAAFLGRVARLPRGKCPCRVRIEISHAHVRAIAAYSPRARPSPTTQLRRDIPCRAASGPTKPGFLENWVVTRIRNKCTYASQSHYGCCTQPTICGRQPHGPRRPDLLRASTCRRTDLCCLIAVVRFHYLDQWTPAGSSLSPTLAQGPLVGFLCA